MKRLMGTCFAVAALGLAAGCSSDETPAGPGTGPVAEGVVEVRDAITSDTTWEADKTYVLKQHVFVEGATLTIPAGTRVLGEPGSSLVVQTTGRLQAEGTESAPIVFTSAQAEGSRDRGDWGGVVLLGRARINVDGGIEQVEGISGETNRTEYGGTDDAHNCGTLRYARIEFAGFELSKDNELNGLTVAGCGTSTVLDYIQVHRGADDGVEFFGGSAGISHLVVTGADDDSLDWDLGWRGQAQFLVIQQYPGVGNYGIEADNNGDALESEPRSNPEIWNATFIGRPKGGSAKSIGMLFREGTGVRLRNSIIVDFPEGAIDVADTSTAAQFTAGNLVVRNTLFWNIQEQNDTLFQLKNQKKDAQGNVTSDDVASFDEAASFLTNEPTNRMADPGLVDARSTTAPNFAVAATSQALDASLTGEPGLAFQADARFLGGVGSIDWTQNWTAYPEN